MSYDANTILYDSDVMLLDLEIADDSSTLCWEDSLSNTMFGVIYAALNEISTMCIFDAIVFFLIVV